MPGVPHLTANTMLPNNTPFLTCLGSRPENRAGVRTPLSAVIRTFLGTRDDRGFMVRPANSVTRLIELLHLGVHRRSGHTDVFKNTL